MRINSERILARVSQLQTWVDRHRLVFGYRLDEVERDRDDWSRAAQRYAEDGAAVQRQFDVATRDYAQTLADRERWITRLKEDLRKAYGLPRLAPVDIKCDVSSGMLGEGLWQPNSWSDARLRVFQIDGRMWTYRFVLPQFNIARMSPETAKDLIDFHTREWSKHVANDVSTQVSVALSKELIKARKE